MKPRRSRVFAALTAFVALGLLLGVSFSGCSGKRTEPKPPITLHPQPSDAPLLKPPIRLAVQCDKTQSWNQTKAMQVAWEDFEIVIEALRKAGGELACGLVRDMSNHGLIRLKIDTPPSPPQKPSEQGNVYVRERERKDYEQKLRDFETKQTDWEKQTQDRIATFKNAVLPLLNSAADAGATDVMGALARSNSFLSEPGDVWPQPPQLFALLVSDCEDNVGKGKVQLQPGAKLLVANGLASAGSLNEFKPKMFESARAALEWVAKQASS